jgi:Relaxase/Mobilisation nuclease domain
MIVKVKSFKRPSFKKLLEYMLHDNARLFDEKDKSFVLTHNLKGDDIEKWVNQFKENETHRLRKRKDSVILTHEILSWHRDDAKNISLDKMQEMARKYIQKRNPKGVYVAVPHFDKEHYHIHICASGVEYRAGKAMRMSKADFGKLKKEIQNYQIEHFPELSKSVVAHGKKEKGKTSDREYNYKLRTGRDTQKEQVIGMLKTCYKKANSRNTFYQLLNECGLITYDRGGKATGIIFGRNKFRFNRIGFTEDRIEMLNIMHKKQKELSELRGNSKNRVRNINR